jgi:hypothetical protein
MMGWRKDRSMGELEDHLPYRTIQDIHDRMARGWSLGDAARGKGWEQRLPHWASWPGSVEIRGYEAGSLVSLGLHIPPVELVVHQEVVGADRQHLDATIDRVIRDWIATNGTDRLEALKAGWAAQEDWHVRYPSLTAWLARGKRFCVRMKFNLVTGVHETKAWHYHKPTNSETLLVESKFVGLSEDAVLSTFDCAIRDWLERNPTHEFPGE